MSFGKQSEEYEESVKGTTSGYDEWVIVLKKKAPLALERNGAFRRGKKPGISDNYRPLQAAPQKKRHIITDSRLKPHYLCQIAAHAMYRPLARAILTATRFFYRVQRLPVCRRKSSGFRNFRAFLTTCIAATVAGFTPFTETQFLLAFWANNLKLGFLPLETANVQCGGGCRFRGRRFSSG